MKEYSMDDSLPPRLGRPPVSRSAARNYFVLNQLAAPGLGTFLAGYRLLGLGQFLLALAGFILVITWCILVGFNAYRLFQTGAEPEPVAKYGLAGIALFAAAWCWSLITSRKLLRAAKEN